MDNLAHMEAIVSYFRRLEDALRDEDVDPHALLDPTTPVSLEAARKLAETVIDTKRRLQASERITAHLLANALISVVMTDSEDRIVFWNIEATRLYGWSAEQALGQDLAELLIPSRYQAAHRSGLRTFLAAHTDTLPYFHRPVRAPAICRDGREIETEMLVAVVHVEGLMRFIAFARSTELPRDAASPTMDALLAAHCPTP